MNHCRCFQLSTSPYRPVEGNIPLCVGPIFPPPFMRPVRLSLFSKSCVKKKQLYLSSGRWTAQWDGHPKAYLSKSRVNRQGYAWRSHRERRAAKKKSGGTSVDLLELWGLDAVQCWRGHPHSDPSLRAPPGHLWILNLQVEWSQVIRQVRNIPISGPY